MAEAAHSPADCATLVEVARMRSAMTPEKASYTFLEDGEADERSLTYAELDAWACRIATALRARVPPGSRVLLLCPPGLDYVAAFFGCLYAAMVAVPAYPPVHRRFVPRLRAVATDAAAAIALAPSASAWMSAGAADTAWSMPWLATDALRLEPRPASFDWQVRPEDLAMLQYTSGSTGDPKGVMVTHANLFQNSRLIDAWLGRPPDSPGVTWLPPYHDLGLIGGILQPMYAGFLAVMMSPLSFAQRPVRWLEAIDRYRATVSGGPNFGYELCVETTTEAERERLDLSSWRFAFCGAEPVRASTVRAFNTAFGPRGFRDTSFYPGYGLAEATLMVTGKARGASVRVVAFDAVALERGALRPDAGSERKRELVGCGPPIPEHELLVVDPETRSPVHPGTIGEIWVRGPCVAAGYWQRSRDDGAFDATTSDGVGPFLRTGDLGGVVDGELFVTGRLKDLVIVRGKKYAPADIEAAAMAAVAALGAIGAVAFSVDRGESQSLVILVETRRRLGPEDQARVETAVRRVVSAEFQLQADVVRVVAPGSIPRTSSGKAQRVLCRDSYLADQPERLSHGHA